MTFQPEGIFLAINSQLLCEWATDLYCNGNRALRQVTAINLRCWLQVPYRILHSAICRLFTAIPAPQTKTTGIFDWREPLVTIRVDKYWSDMRDNLPVGYALSNYLSLHGFGNMIGPGG